KEKYDSFRQIEGKGRLLMPGWINAHMHLYSTFARGIALPSPPANFYEILSKLWWKLDSVLDWDAVYYSALIPAITAVKKGVTAFIDHHASANAVDGSLDCIEEALALVGMRGILCYEVTDRYGKEVRINSLMENERYAKKCDENRGTNSNHLYDALVGLHASFTLEDETLEEAATLQQSLQIGGHIHVLEDALDARLTHEKYKTSVVERLAEYQLLGEQTIAAHGIYLSAQEKDLLSDTDTIVVHNPQSNMNNAVGRTDIFGLLDRDILVGLGTDGMTPDVKVDARTANLLHKHDLKKPNIGWEEIQHMLLKSNPEIYRRISGRLIGKVEPGYLADLILVDYFPATPLTGDNFWGHFLFAIADAPVDTTIINGEIVMGNQQLPHIDEAKIAVEAREVAEEVWQAFENHNDVSL
ncbi:MAG: putative aminohydrolase SsnA, partial [candidate division Zixibacteria bacterium]|nr:putative aminohydrolase SsnA [candidate division KSB1 bacterium]NIR63136.1 putative aminohydrolase SsnA [candidate division Zixibacteria bacterium]NIS45121.1 putative aminohydrolase SsnA [candidate division Zixibacteria bacterium]NIT69420.1 putative aminohydrolase SsnA [candidate division KSB1 bacterium]NIU13281.1 putative aminohydrolase SsnA [candidate division Zixibacteria bacterium]